MSERLKSLSYSELIQKYKALRQYIRDVEEEIELRDKKKGDNTFPLFKEPLKKLNDKLSSKKVSEKKTTSKKTTPKKKLNDDEDTKNEIGIKATMKIMKEVLDDHDILYKSNITKEGLIKLVRENHLVRKCNTLSEKIKKK
jgi:TPP-dependent 2-oxoacid decarboxylase